GQPGGDASDPDHGPEARDQISVTGGRRGGAAAPGGRRRRNGSGGVGGGRGLRRFRCGRAERQVGGGGGEDRVGGGVAGGLGLGGGAGLFFGRPAATAVGHWPLEGGVGLGRGFLHRLRRGFRLRRRRDDRLILPDFRIGEVQRRPVA